MSADDKPLDVQIGGDHYKSMAIQPMEYSMANKLDACQHTIIKYVTRFRDKGGIQDLEKAKHCIDLLIHFERQSAALSFVDEAREFIDHADVEIASAIDDDSERMQAIGQNGEMASEVYAAVDYSEPWKSAPEWAKYKAQDKDGSWFWYAKKPYIDEDDQWYSEYEMDLAYDEDDENLDWKLSLIAR